MIQRFEDWMRERRIARLRVESHRIIESRGIEAARPVIRQLFDECAARSPAQIDRMERNTLAQMSPADRAHFEEVRARKERRHA